MPNHIRYTVAEYSRNTFYQLPAFLFDAEFSKLSNDAKILYTLLRARHDLSVKNGWQNEKGEIYLTMTREEMCEMLNASMHTVIKTITELKKYDLLDEERPGQGKPNRIYLLQVKTCKIYDSRPAKTAGQDMQNLHPKYIDNNKIDSIYISTDPYHSTNPPDKGSFDTNEFYEAAKRRTERDKP